MFSFVNPDSPQRLRVRLGREAKPGGCWTPRWSRPFHLHPGVHHDKLLLHHSDKARPPTVYNFGAEVRGGQGLFASTNFVVLTPQFQLDNGSRFTLLVAQQEEQEPDDRCTKVGPGCCLPWHWPMQDRAQLLCVKRTDLAHWSSGFPLNHLRSFHLNMRNREREPRFVRVEILLHGAMYYVTFSDAEGLPPPIRIVNDSQVPVLFRQAGALPAHLKAVLRPDSQADYNWDRAVEAGGDGEAAFELTGYGSRSERYELSTLGAHQPLLYQNFVFLLFPATFPQPTLSPTTPQPSEATELVLHVLQNGKVILTKTLKHHYASPRRQANSPVTGYPESREYGTEEESLSTLMNQ
jgi:vacuolar protein sorting-associated protein 13D